MRGGAAARRYSGNDPNSPRSTAGARSMATAAAGSDTPPPVPSGRTLTASPSADGSSPATAYNYRAVAAGEGDAAAEAGAAEQSEGMSAVGEEGGAAAGAAACSGLEGGSRGSWGCTSLNGAVVVRTHNSSVAERATSALPATTILVADRERLRGRLNTRMRPIA